MIELDLQVTGIDELRASWQGIPVQLRGRLIEALTSSMVEVAGLARSNAPKRTGDLAGSVDVQVQDSPQQVTGRVIVNDYKGRFVEGGIKGEVAVKSYARHLAGLDRYDALSSKGRKLRQPRRTHVGVGVVKAYTRTMDIPPRPFLEPAFQAMRDHIEARLAQALDQTVEAANG